MTSISLMPGDNAVGGDAGSGGAPAANLSLEDIERNELALKAEVYSKVDRAGQEEAAAGGRGKSVSGITVDNLMAQLRALGHDVTREFVNDIFCEITKSSGQQSIELPDFLKFLDDPTYAPEPDDEVTAGAPSAAAAAGAGDVKYPAASPKAAGTPTNGGGDGKGPDAAALAEQRKKELVERKLNAPMTADTLETVYRHLQSAHPSQDGLTVADFEAAFRITRETPDAHRGVLSAVKQPTAQELQELLKQMDPYSPDVILRDALARWVLINDHVTVGQPLFLTQQPGAAGLPTPQGAMVAQMSTASLGSVGAAQMGTPVAPLPGGMNGPIPMMALNGSPMMGMGMPLGAAGGGAGPRPSMAVGPPLIKQLSSSGSGTSLHGSNARKSVMQSMV